MICVGIERPLRKVSGGHFLGRGRFPWLSDASHRDVDESQFDYCISGFTNKKGHPIGCPFLFYDLCGNLPRLSDASHRNVDESQSDYCI